MLISLLVAAAENNVIGKNNALIWHLPNDMLFFKNTTWAMPVIMGRKTFESMGRPLKGRTNIVITRNPAFKAGDQNVLKAANADEAIKLAAGTDALECFVIGGGEIFREVMPRAHRIYMTRVHAAPDGDVSFPEISSAEWELKSSRRFEADERHVYPYTFEIWERKSSN